MKRVKTEAVATKGGLMQVGLEMVPVYGDEASGYSLDLRDVSPWVPAWCRYESLDELFFALVNLNVCPEGRA